MGFDLEYRDEIFMISFFEKIVIKNKIWNDIKIKKWEYNVSYIWVIIKGVLYKVEK